MYRLFVAIDLPEKVKEHLLTISGGIPGARWMTPDRLHLTLRFIGEVDGGRFRDVSDALREVNGDAFELTLKGVGHFPPRKDPETIWVGVEKNDSLAQLRNRIETVLARTGVERETRKFSPHVVLARLHRAPVNRVAGFMAEHALVHLEPFAVTRFLLYSSVLSSQGALYQVESEYLLNGKGIFTE